MVWVPPGYELATESPAPQDESHLWDHIWLVWRGRWLVALVFLFCVGIAAVKMLRATPIYEATAKLHIGLQSPKIVDMGEVETFVSREFVDSQIQVIMSRTLARQVVEEYDLFAPVDKGDKEVEEDTGSVKSAIASFTAYLKSFVPKAGGDDGSRTQEDIAQRQMAARINRFVGALSISRISATEIVEIKFLDPNPSICALVANAVCDAYTRWNYQTKTSSYEYASKWIDQKLYEVKANLEKSEETLYKFAGGQDVLALAENIEDFSSKLEERGQSLATAEEELNDREFQLDSTRKGIRPADLIDDSRLKELQVEVAKREVIYDEVLQQFGPEMSEVKVLKAAKARLELQITEELERIQSERKKKDKLALAKAQFDYDRAKSQRDFLNKSYDEQKKRFLGIQQRLIKYNILKREVDVNKDLYNSLLLRSREVGITSGLKAGNVSIVEVAEQPLSPKLPNKKRTILLGAFLGLFLGIGLVFFREYMDTTVRGALDIENIAGMATLGLLPHLDTGRSKKGGEIHPEKITAEKPRSAFAENVRHLRTSVQYSLPGHSPKTILVTSALPAEGKTTVSTNLAISLAQNGHRTILVDADLKKPGIHKFFDIDRNNGLSDILTGKTNGKLNGHIVRTDIENLFVLPSGARPPNPVDLLDSILMRRLLVALAEHFDHVILDSAPSLDLADTGVLFPYVDGVVLVVKPGKTPRRALAKVNEKVLGLGGNVLGVVLNDRRARTGKRYGYGYRYDYKYGGYGSSYGEETPSIK